MKASLRSDLNPAFGGVDVLSSNARDTHTPSKTNVGRLLIDCDFGLDSIGLLVNHCSEMIIRPAPRGGGPI